MKFGKGTEFAKNGALIFGFGYFMLYLPLNISNVNDEKCAYQTFFGLRISPWITEWSSGMGICRCFPSSKTSTRTRIETNDH
jgi:hypothetical protein